MTRWRVLSSWCRLRFDSQRGAVLAGTVDCDSVQGAFTGTLTGDRDVSLVVGASGVVLAGTLELRQAGDMTGSMDLVQTGGPESGRVLNLRFECGYTYCAPRVILD